MQCTNNFVALIVAFHNVGKSFNVAKVEEFNNFKIKTFTYSTKYLIS
jgi:hypothetical protein